MKTLKITFCLLAIFVLTVSGQSSTVLIENELPTISDGQYHYQLLAHEKKGVAVPSHG